MFFAVKELELRKIPFATSFAPGQIEFLDTDVQQGSPFEVSGLAELTEPLEEIRVRGHLTGTVTCGCDRCLEPVEVPFDAGFDLSYWPADAEWESGETRLSRSNTEVGYYEGDGLELAEVVREQVLLWLPMQRLCRPDCKGICPVCGQDRNVSECSCSTEEEDERWRALREL